MPDTPKRPDSPPPIICPFCWSEQIATVRDAAAPLAEEEWRCARCHALWHPGRLTLLTPPPGPISTGPPRRKP